MAIVVPFKGIRPAGDKVHLVASRSVDSYSNAAINSKLAENPYSFMHVVRPEFGQAVKTKSGPELYKKVKRKFEQFRESKILVQESAPAFYIYRQEKEGNAHTGIIGCSSVHDYFNDVIKIHEQTLTEREQKLREYLEICDFNAEPVCMIYPDNDVITELTDKYVSSINPLYHFTTTDKVTHTLWIVNSQADIETVKNAFSAMPAIYIADGHHRSASSALLAREKKEKMGELYTGIEPFNYFMCVYFPESQINIYGFNRAIKGGRNVSSEELLSYISKNFEVEKCKSKSFTIQSPRTFCMYLKDEWYLLKFKKEILSKIDYSQLDAQLLTDMLLAPVFNISDLKTDKRVSFVSGVNGTEALERLVHSGKADVAFQLYPVSVEQLKKIADSHGSMPPKTTWIEPKMRSGLVVYSLS